MLKTVIKDQVKEAMKAKDMERLGMLRQITAAIKQVEVDTRQDLDEQAVLSLLEKMKKQRIDAFEQFTNAGREDLASKEQQEIQIIQEFLPEPLNVSEIEDIVSKAISTTNASQVSDMGKVMALVKPQVLGRASMKEVGEKIKSLLEN